MEQRLIDANVAREKFSSKYKECEATGKIAEQIAYDDCICYLDSCDTIKNGSKKHGKLISEIVKFPDWKGKKRDYYQPWSCSDCHKPDANKGKSKFCSNCGAKMDGDQNVRV